MTDSVFPFFLRWFFSMITVNQIILVYLAVLVIVLGITHLVRRWIF